MRFKPGQKVVCIANCNGNWEQVTELTWLQYLNIQPRKTNGPKFNEIVTVDDHDHDEYAIALKEYDTYKNGKRNTFLEKYFEPLVSDNVLEMELASCREPDFI